MDIVRPGGLDVLAGPGQCTRTLPPAHYGTCGTCSNSGRVVRVSESKVLFLFLPSAPRFGKVFLWPTMSARLCQRRGRRRSLLLLGLQLCGEASGVRGAASDTPAGAGLTPPAVTLLSNASVLSGCSGSHCSEGAHPEAPPRVRHSAMDELSVFAAHHGRAVSLFGRGSAGSNFTHDEEDSTQAFFQNSLAPILASSGCFLLLMLVVALARYRLGSPLPAKGKDCFSSAMLPCHIERNSRFSLSIIPDALADVWCPAGKPKVEHAKADRRDLQRAE